MCTYARRGKLLRPTPNTRSHNEGILLFSFAVLSNFNYICLYLLVWFVFTQKIKWMGMLFYKVEMSLKRGVKRFSDFSVFHAKVVPPKIIRESNPFQLKAQTEFH